MALDGLLFDIDGTLLDSNALHVEAWGRALKQHEYTIAPDRIFSEVGKGGDRLIPALLGTEAEKKDGEALRKAQPRELDKLIDERGVKAFPKVRELLETTRALGLKTALVTSSGKPQLDLLLRGAGMDLTKLVDEVVLADDVRESKPAPDLVTVAANKLKLTVAQCAMVGDTPYDAESAKYAGAVTLGVMSGGHDEATLRSAGARVVYRDTADLLDHLDEALRLSSPGSAHLDQQLLEKLMRQALAAAETGLAAGEVPIGCVLARGDGTVIASGFNELNRSQNKTAHAEMVTFRKSAGRVPVDARDLILVSTLEPCVMCTGAAMEAAVDTILYGLRAPADSGTARVRPPQSPESQMPRIVGDILASDSRMLFEEWLKRNPDGSQTPFVKQLLELTK